MRLMGSPCQGSFIPGRVDAKSYPSPSTWQTTRVFVPLWQTRPFRFCPEIYQFFDKKIRSFSDGNETVTDCPEEKFCSAVNTLYSFSLTAIRTRVVLPSVIIDITRPLTPCVELAEMVINVYPVDKNITLLRSQESDNSFESGVTLLSSRGRPEKSRYFSYEYLIDP